MLIAPDLQPHVHSTPAHCELKGCAATGSRYSPGKALEGYQHGPSAWHWGLEWLICGWLRGCLFCFGWRLAWLFWGGLNDGSKMPEVQVAAWLKWYYGRAIKNQWNCEVNYRSSYQPSTKRLQDAFECFRPLQGRNSDQSTTISIAKTLASLFRIEFVAITALDISHSLILIIAICPCWLFDMALIHMGPVPRLLNPIACRF